MGDFRRPDHLYIISYAYIPLNFYFYKNQTVYVAEGEQGKKTVLEKDKTQSTLGFHKNYVGEKKIPSLKIYFQKHVSLDNPPHMQFQLKILRRMSLHAKVSS